MTRIKSHKEIEAMREAGRMLAQVLNVVRDSTKPGMSTKDLALIAKRELKSLGGQPSFLGYQGFPDVLCVSLNDEVVHGIPSASRILENGDLVSIDFGVTHKGMITDSAISYFVGKVKDKQKQELLATTELALEEAIKTLSDGVRVGDISAAAQKIVEEHNFGIVRDLVGHGVGHELHELPNIPNYGKSNSGPKLSAGMTIAIEPMVTLGSHKVIIDQDGWTVRTADGSLAAHFEHTVLITVNGYEIITARN
jgi:methionyl aminopeptidase